MDENTSAEIESLEVDPLSDEDLESVAGGAETCSACGSNSQCSNPPKPGFDEVAS